MTGPTATLDPSSAPEGVPGSGERMHALAAELFPLPRSITGEGLRATLERVGREIPLDVTEVPSGTRVLDWTVPDEWSVRDAYVKDASGRKVIDFQESNLHLVGYSVPVEARMTLEELRPRLHSLPEQPDLVPYRTSYYRENWGFCLTHRQLEALPEGEYEVRIDATLAPGSLTYGECVIEGSSGAEVLITAHACHPSLANDNLSGVVVAVETARLIARRTPRHTYRFLFAPGTIGAIAWLARSREEVAAIRAGLVLAGVGDAGGITYKRSRRGDSLVDRAMQYVLGRRGGPSEVRPFTPTGYDERQYCSPGFDLPVGCLMRTPHGEYPEYHTSADDLSFIRPASLEDTLACLVEWIEVVEREAVYRNLSPYGEPQLGRRGLYSRNGGEAEVPDRDLALLWVLNGSDGATGLLELAERSGIPLETLSRAAAELVEAGLLASVRGGAGGPG